MRLVSASNQPSKVMRQHQSIIQSLALLDWGLRTQNNIRTNHDDIKSNITEPVGFVNCIYPAFHNPFPIVITFASPTVDVSPFLPGRSRHAAMTNGAAGSHRLTVAESNPVPPGQARSVTEARSGHAPPAALSVYLHMLYRCVLPFLSRGAYRSGCNEWLFYIAVKERPSYVDPCCHPPPKRHQGKQS